MEKYEVKATPYSDLYSFIIAEMSTGNVELVGFNYKNEAQERCDELNEKEGKMKLTSEDIKWQGNEKFAFVNGEDGFVFLQSENYPINVYKDSCYIIERTEPAKTVRDNTKNPARIIHIVNMIEGCVSLLTEGPNKRLATICISEMSNHAGQHEFNEYYIADKEVLKPALNAVKWVNGDECVILDFNGFGVRDSAARWLGKTAIVMALFKTPNGFNCAALHIDGYGCEVFLTDLLSRPESAADKAMRERAEVKAKLWGILCVDEANAAEIVGMEFAIDSLIDAGVIKG
jgi:hypothetical protein